MIEIVPASKLQVGDVFSTDGYAVVSAYRDEDGNVAVRVGQGGHEKFAVVNPDFPCPLYREV